ACCVLAFSRTPQCCLPVCLTPSAHLSLAISELTTSGYPACMCPCPGFGAPLCGGSAWSFVPTLRVRPCSTPSHGSGSGWFATPFLYDSFIHYFTPVYPDAIQAKTPAPPKLQDSHQVCSARVAQAFSPARILQVPRFRLPVSSDVIISGNLKTGQ